MRLLFFVTFFSISAIGYSQSYLLSEGQSSTTVPLIFASQNGETQIGSGYIYSKNGKFDLGLGVTYLTNSQIFAFQPFYRAFLYNDRDADGPAIATAISYTMLLDQNGNTAHIGGFTPSFFYRIPTEKVVITPQFDASFAKNLEGNGSSTSYAIIANFAFNTDKGFITFSPRYQFANNIDGLFSLGLNYQWVRSNE